MLKTARPEDATWDDIRISYREEGDPLYAHVLAVLSAPPPLEKTPRDLLHVLIAAVPGATALGIHHYGGNVAANIVWHGQGSVLFSTEVGAEQIRRASGKMMIFNVMGARIHAGWMRVLYQIEAWREGVTQ